VKFEQKYLVFSSNRQQAASWTGTDESGTPASLTEVSYGNIELRNGMSVMIGSYLMQGGDGPGKPHRIDIYDNMEMGPQLKQLGIYEMHGDSLRLCLAAPGDYRPNAFHQSGGARLYRLKKSTP
jgi:hypothetical protein